MTIRAIAKDLYRAQQAVSRLEAQLALATETEKQQLNQELRAARAELQALRRILEGEKESGSFRKKFGGFGR